MYKVRIEFEADESETLYRIEDLPDVVEMIGTGEYHLYNLLSDAASKIVVTIEHDGKQYTAILEQPNED